MDPQILLPYPIWSTYNLSVSPDWSSLISLSFVPAIKTTGHNKNKISGENSTKWGGVGWLRNDIIGMLLDSEIHNEISESFFDDNYLRINSPLGKVNKLLDDDSDENLERIHLMGMEWWSEFGEKTLKFIEN